MPEKVEIEVTPAMTEAYGHEQDERARRMTRLLAPHAVEHSWEPEALNEDGSLQGTSEGGES